MSLYVKVHNISPASNVVCNYEVAVRVNERVIYEGVIFGHNRANGWTKLLHMIADDGDAEALRNCLKPNGEPL